MDPRIIALYDDFTHGHLDRRLFLDRLSRLVGSTAAALLVLPQLEPGHAHAQTVPEAAPRLRAGDVTYLGSTGTMKGYVARPAGDARAPGVIVIHENRGLQPHIRDVPRRAALAGYVALAPDLTSDVPTAHGETVEGLDPAGLGRDRPRVAAGSATVTSRRQAGGRR